MIIQENTRVGNLVIIGEPNFKEDKNGKIRGVYKSKCVCDNVIELTEKQLTKGSIKCCGCRAKVEDLVGIKFGKLSTVRQSGFKYYESGTRVATWLCSCECGGEKLSTSTSLKSGQTWHCGCENKRTKSLVGQNFGKLTVLETDGEFVGYAKTVYICECECGEKVTRKHRSLAGKRTKSCGCYVIDDITNKRFGKLIVLGKGKQKTNRGRLFWLCRCECGKEKEIDGAALKSGATVSCGCYQRSLGQTRAQSRDRIKLLEGKLHYTYQRGAKSRSYSFNLDMETFLSLIYSPCYYCGKTESNESKDYYVKEVSLKYNGIDRVDNNKGYEIENVVPCCSNCNRMKLEQSKEDYLQWIKSIVNNLELGV